MKKIITFILISLCAVLFISSVSFAKKYDKQCVADCSIKENGCHRSCAESYHLEMNECDAKSGTAKQDCIVTLNGNFGQCQSGCNDMDNMCIDRCMTKKK